nr:hypothetical protein [Tanacetum cinerariifolium]
MNEDCYHEQNSCYNSNSFGFDQFLPQQLHVIDQTPLEESMKNLRIAFQACGENMQQKTEAEEKQIAEEQAETPICYDDDEDYTIAITPKEPDNSQIWGTSILTLFRQQRIHKKIYSNPLFDEEIISIKIDPHHFNDKSDLIESLLNHNSLIISSFLKIDYLLNEFAGELILLKSIPPGIEKADCDPEEEIQEFISKNSDAIIESFSASPILVEDSDPFMEEINLFLASDGSIPSGIDNDYSNSEWDNLILERLLHDDPIPLSDTLNFSNVVQVFLPFFTYPVTSSILLSSRSEDTFFDPVISNYKFSSLEPCVSHRSGTFMKINVYPNYLNESLMEILSSTCFLMDQ